jgi:hypothetical protein
MTVDQFWIAALKILPYEVTGAYGIIFGGYLATHNAFAVGWLFFAVVALSIVVFFLHRTVTGASWANALAMAILFFLFALSMNAEAFKRLLVDGTSVWWPQFSNVLDVLIDPFPALIAAMLIVLATASLRTILAKPPPS